MNQVQLMGISSSNWMDALGRVRVVLNGVPLGMYPAQLTQRKEQMSAAKDGGFSVVSKNRLRPNRRANQFDAGRITAFATR